MKNDLEKFCLPFAQSHWLRLVKLFEKMPL